MRLFIGTFLDKDLVEKIPFDGIKNLFGDDLKQIKKENIHMTWVFVGNVEAIYKLPLQEIIVKHFTLFKNLVFQSNALELWPLKRPPRLIVLSGNLSKEIYLKDLICELKTICSPDEKENFLSHITISRFKKDKTIDKKIELPKIEKFTWQIKEISLIQSILTSEGPKYEKIKNWEL